MSPLPNPVIPKPINSLLSTGHGAGSLIHGLCNDKKSKQFAIPGKGSCCVFHRNYSEIGYVKVKYREKTGLRFLLGKLID
jgi:hypothetical protein